MFFSHILAIRYFLENDKNNYCLILEDDNSFEVFKEYNLDFDGTVKKIANESPIDYGIIQLSFITGGNSPFIKKASKLYEKWKRFYGACAYLINKNAAMVIIKSLYQNKNKIQIDIYNNSFKLYLADFYFYNYVKTYTYKIPFFIFSLGNSTISSDEITHAKAYQNLKNTIYFHRNTILTKFPKKNLNI